MAEVSGTGAAVEEEEEEAGEASSFVVLGGVECCFLGLPLFFAASVSMHSSGLPRATHLEQGRTLLHAV